MLDLISNSVNSVMNMGAAVLDAIFTTNGSWSVVQPLIGIGIAMGVIGFAVRTIKSLSWGF